MDRKDFIALLKSMVTKKQEGQHYWEDARRLLEYIKQLLLMEGDDLKSHVGITFRDRVIPFKQLTGIKNKVCVKGYENSQQCQLARRLVMFAIRGARVMKDEKGALEMVMPGRESNNIRSSLISGIKENQSGFCSDNFISNGNDDPSDDAVLAEYNKADSLRKAWDEGHEAAIQRWPKAKSVNDAELDLKEGVLSKECDQETYASWRKVAVELLSVIQGITDGTKDDEELCTKLKNAEGKIVLSRAKFEHLFDIPLVPNEDGKTWQNIAEDVYDDDVQKKEALGRLLADCAKVSRIVDVANLVQMGLRVLFHTMPDPIKRDISGSQASHTARVKEDADVLTMFPGKKGKGELKKLEQRRREAQSQESRSKNEAQRQEEARSKIEAQRQEEARSKIEAQRQEEARSKTEAQRQQASGTDVSVPNTSRSGGEQDNQSKRAQIKMKKKRRGALLGGDDFWHKLALTEHPDKEMEMIEEFLSEESDPMNTWIVHKNLMGVIMGYSSARVRSFAIDIVRKHFVERPGIKKREYAHIVNDVMVKSIQYYFYSSASTLEFGWSESARVMLRTCMRVLLDNPCPIDGLAVIVKMILEPEPTLTDYQKTALLCELIIESMASEDGMPARMWKTAIHKVFSDSDELNPLKCFLAMCNVLTLHPKEASEHSADSMLHLLAFAHHCLVTCTDPFQTFAKKWKRRRIDWDKSGIVCLISIHKPFALLKETYLTIILRCLLLFLWVLYNQVDFSTKELKGLHVDRDGPWKPTGQLVPLPEMDHFVNSGGLRLMDTFASSTLRDSFKWQTVVFKILHFMTFCYSTEKILDLFPSLPAYALLVLSEYTPQKLFVEKRASPLDVLTGAVSVMYILTTDKTTFQKSKLQPQTALQALGEIPRSILSEDLAQYVQVIIKRLMSQ